MNVRIAKRRSTGFTLVELLVVITIIGVLMSLVMPAVNSAMETASNLKCRNNLKNLNDAINSFCADKDGRYPGHTNSIGTKNVSWLVMMFPKIGQQALYDDIRDGKDPEQYIELLVCPSNPPDSQDNPSSAYRINAGSTDTTPNKNTEVPPNRNPANGIAFNCSGTNKIYNRKSSIVDGHTLLLCEMADIGSWNATGQTGCGFVWTIEGETGEKAINNDEKTAHPGSKHASGGANVVFTNNSCRTLSESIDYPVYQQLMTPNAKLSDMPNKEIVINELDL